MAALGLFTFKPSYFILFMFKPLKFYKNTTELFQNYVFVPIILSLDLQLPFYNYD
jgi:hypothetical protein